MSKTFSYSFNSLFLARKILSFAVKIMVFRHSFQNLNRIEGDVRWVRVLKNRRYQMLFICVRLSGSKYVYINLCIVLFFWGKSMISVRFLKWVWCKVQLWLCFTVLVDLFFINILTLQLDRFKYILLSVPKCSKRQLFNKLSCRAVFLKYRYIVSTEQFRLVNYSKFYFNHHFRGGNTCVDNSQTLTLKMMQYSSVHFKRIPLNHNKNSVYCSCIFFISVDFVCQINFVLF